MRTKWALAGKHLAGKGVHAVDGLDDDEKGIATVYTPGGTQQITVQHVPDEWKGIANTYTLGGVQQVSIISEAPPHPPAILRAATTSILRALPRSLFSPGTFDPRPFLHPGTAAMLRKHGISPAGFTSSQVHPFDADSYDWIIAMDDSNIDDLKRVIRFNAEQTFKITDLIPESGYFQVPDPWYTGDFDETYRLVSAGSQALLRKLGLL